MKLLDPKLVVFVAVAKNKSMHAAAKEIHLSQTAITQRIRTLERRLRATLFIRTSHGVQLTDDGEALLRYCHHAIELEGEALAKITGSGIETTARIGIIGPSSVMASRIILQCLDIMKKFPKLMLSFDINDAENRIQTLQTGVNHFAVLEPESIQKEMKIKKLNPEKYVLVCTKKWKSRELKEIIQSEKIIDFDAGDSMTFNYLKAYKLFDYAHPDRHFVNRTDSLATMMIDGHGYGVLSQEFAKSYVDKGQLIVLNKGKEYKNPLVLAWYDRPEPSKYFSSIISALN